MCKDNKNGNCRFTPYIYQITGGNMDKPLSESRGISAFGITMVLGGLALLLSVAMLGFGAQGASANTARGPLAQGTQPIIVTPTLTLTSTPVATSTEVATVEPTATGGATGT